MKGKIIKCVVCNGDFQRRFSREKCCSQKCSKICVYAYQAQWRKEHPEGIRKTKRQWRLNNPDKVSAQKHRSYIKHKDKIIKKVTKYYVLNKEKIIKRIMEYEKKNIVASRLRKNNWGKSKKGRITIKAYKEKNRESINEWTRNYQNKRRKEDFQFYIRGLLANRLKQAFSLYSKNGKCRTSDEYGINYQNIIEYIGPCPGERREYHIDHIVPLCSFDFDDSEQVKLAFKPENHQWLTCSENIKKSNKISKEYNNEIL